MNRTLSLQLIGWAVLVLLAACGGSTNLSSTWLNESFEAHHIGQTLVVGVASEANNRVRFEDRFAEQLSAHGVDAVASNQVMALEDELTRATVEAILDGQNYHSVLVTRLISEDTRRIYTPPASEWQHGSTAALYHAIARSAFEDGAPGTYVEQHVVVIETALYDLETEELVWTAETETVDPDELEATLQDVVRTLVAALADSGLL